MSADQAPARKWYELAVETAAVKGWSLADLSSRSGVARSTIYGWRDNPRKPQAKSVNAVADVLGIQRDRALRAAGIIAAAEAEPAVPPDVLEVIRRRYSPRQQREIIELLQELSAPPGGAASPGEQTGRAG